MEWIGEHSEIVRDLAWPAMAFLVFLWGAVLGGFRTLIRDLTPEVKKFNEFNTNIKEYLGRIFELESKFKDLQVTLKRQVGELDSRLSDVGNSFSEDLSNEISAIEKTLSDLILRAASISEHSKVHGDASGEGGPVEQFSESAAYEETASVTQVEQLLLGWQSIVEKIRNRARDMGVHFDGRSVASVATKMSDQRRNNPISKELEEMIAEAFSRVRSIQLDKEADWYKSFIEETTATINNIGERLST